MYRASDARTTLNFKIRNVKSKFEIQSQNSKFKIYEPEH